MKCKICGHRTNTINAMRIHYLKKHPAAMKRKRKKVLVIGMTKKERERAFCPHCGAKL